MTSLKLFNTLSRSLEPFVPLDRAGRKVGMYCCGPTVYDFGHIGNFRTFVFADLVRRHLEFRGFDVTQVMNITDVEDKIIRRVHENGLPLREYTGRFEAAFLEDLGTLNCLRPHQLPRATEHIPEIIALIGKLVARGLAYRTPDGSVYFSIEKYRGCGCRYGQLVTLNFDQMRAGERVASDEYEKDAVADFALWKAHVPEDGDVSWDSPWGPGRPGWHIECSAMSMAQLGRSFDLHLGGEDLMFPHHEDEIAQSEGAEPYPPGEHFVKYWLHAAHLLVDGKKMSKSLGNFFTLRDLLEKGYTGREVRQLLLSAHYRETFNFTFSGLDGARAALARIDECVGKLQEMTDFTHTVAEDSVVRAFTQAMDDDLNVARAWAVVFDWIRLLNRSIATNSLTVGDAKAALATWHTVGRVFGISAGRPTNVAIAEGVRCIPDTLPPIPVLNGSNDRIAEEIFQLVFERHRAKKAKDFARADAVRAELKAKGWLVEDTPKGPKLKRAS